MQHLNMNEEFVNILLIFFHLAKWLVWYYLLKTYWMKFIVEYFEWIDVSISNSHFLCMDTTNENSGDKKGLKYLLQHRVPLLVWIGCGNHKLALCFKHLTGEYTNIIDARCYLISFMEVFLLSSSGAKLLKRLLNLIKSTSLCQFVLWLLDRQPMG